jgi:hypothetical protein
MFKWLNERMAGTPYFKAAEALRVEWEPLQKIPGVKPRLVDRLIRFVFTGEEETAVAELTAMQNTSYIVSTTYYYNPLTTTKKGLPTLIHLLPEDAKIYFRLATVYYAAAQAGSLSISYNSVPIPALQGSLSWLSVFLNELSSHGNERDQIFPVSVILEMLRLAGHDEDVLLRAAFFYEDAQGKSALSRWSNSPFYYFKCLRNFADLVVKSPEVVRPAFSQKEAGSRAAVLQALATLNVPPDPFVEEIASLAVSGSKEVRENAASIITDRFEIFRKLLKTHAETGSADERYHAVRLLTRIGGDEERVFLTQRLEREKSAKVCDLIKTALSGSSSQQTVAGEDDYGLPEIPEIAVHAPLDKQLLVELRSRLKEIEQRTADDFSRNQFAKSSGWTRTPVKPEAADRLFDALQNLVIKEDTRFPFFENSNGVEQKLLNSFPIPAQFQPIHLVRWCLLLTIGHTGRGGDLDPWSLYQWRTALVSYQKVQKKAIDLREIAVALRAIGLDDRILGRQILQANRFVRSPFLQLDPNRIWQYFAERLDLIEEGLGLKQIDEQQSPYRNYWESDSRRNAFAVLSSFPRPPAKLVPMLWEIALGASKTERTVAQQCLNSLEGKEQTILAALASRQQETRLAAAQWLGALGYAAAIPALRQALSKEKNELVKDELVKSLEILGVPLEELLDLNQLDAEAEKGLKKGIPKDLDWFPFSQLPSVAWADSGQPVPPAIIHWFILQSYKLKNPEAGPTLRRYCSLFRQQDREKLGRFVLEAWIAQDTKPKYTADQAAAQAQKGAQQTALAAKQYPQFYVDFNEQRVYQTLFNQFVVEPEGSQTSTKGILAVAGACCSGEAAPVVHRYVKQWYGYRAAQCKALLQVLAWIDHPSATQVILSVANRFRTKGIQEEALRLCQLLAERKGWTMDELADRTIPTVGFDEAGKMELDYGTRKFNATLSDEMAITLTNQDGKVIASLPDANQSDDAEKVKQAKNALSSARKELKSILTMQKDRLYEALCTQRSWRFDDWDTYLSRHPIAGRYCQRLVWVAYDGEKIIDSFRPLADGTLTNHQDDELKLTPATEIRLGHDETLPHADRTAWLQHLSDYEVEPLFQQFGKQQFSLPDDMKEATDVKDFLGYLVMAFSLRNRLTRSGYTRGAAQDGGWFFEYRKTFLQLGIEAVIEFTGNPLPEQNRTVALQRLYFTRKLDHGSGSMSEELPLGELPRVLLTECWNDLRMAAADGPGFAADWEKQTEF